MNNKRPPPTKLHLTTTEEDIDGIYNDWKISFLFTMNLLRITKSQKSNVNSPLASMALTQSVLFVNSLADIDWPHLGEYWDFSTDRGDPPSLSVEVFIAVQLKMRSLTTEAETFTNKFLREFTRLSEAWLQKGGWAKALKVFLTAFPMSVVSVLPRIVNQKPFIWEEFFRNGHQQNLQLYRLFQKMTEYPNIRSVFRVDGLKSYDYLLAQFKNSIPGIRSLIDDYSYPSLYETSSTTTTSLLTFSTLSSSSSTFSSSTTTSSSSLSSSSSSSSSHSPKKSPKSVARAELRNILGCGVISFAICPFTEAELSASLEASEIQSRYGKKRSLNLTGNLPRLIRCNPIRIEALNEGGKAFLLLDQHLFMDPKVVERTIGGTPCLLRALTNPCKVVKTDKMKFKDPIELSDYPGYLAFELLL